MEKIVYAGAKESFREASASLQALAGFAVSPKEVLRVTERIGQERVAEREAEAQAYVSLPLKQKDESPREQVPQVVAVSMDGGRYQRIDESGCAAEESQATEPSEVAASEGKGRHWREYKAGCLLTLRSQTYAEDPCPEVPATFLNRERVAELAREVHGSRAADRGRPHERARAEPTPSRPRGARRRRASARRARPGAPTLLVRSVVASRQTNVRFGVRLAAAAWARGFAQATRKAFLSDGAPGNWTVWQKFFSRYVPILDWIHLVGYLYAAAMAGRSLAEGWPVYVEWITQLWRGRVPAVLEALRTRLAELGPAGANEAPTDPRAVLAETLRYVENNQSRMRYDEYRRQGLPLTSCHVESTVKQINRRIKGTEKFWSSAGGEALLQLRADYLSDTNPMDPFWQRRQAHATGQRRYTHAA